jgi:hypothetical protein
VAFQNVEAGDVSAVLTTRSLRLQEVYSATMFTTGPIWIRELRFRPSAIHGRPFSTTIADVQVGLSTTPLQYSQLAADFDANPGPDDTMVFKGAINVSSSFAGPPEGPKQFDISLPLTTPFYYDPTVGNLLLDFQNRSGSEAVLVDAGNGGGLAGRLVTVNGQIPFSHDTVDVIELVYTAVDGPPVITRQPQSLTASTGELVRLSVGAVGQMPLAYQWFHGEAMLGGATNAHLTLNGIQSGNAGLYTVVVSNSGGAVTSAVAVLLITNQMKLVVPGVYAGLEGLGASPVLSSPVRLQEVYGSVLFPPRPILIRELRFRPSATHGKTFSADVSKLQINLSTAPPGTLLMEFARNTGPDETVVFSGSITLSSAFSGPPNGPKDFDIVVPFTNPFPYDPDLGNLLVDVRNYSGSTASMVDAVGSWTNPVSRAVTFNPNFPQGSLAAGADVLQIVYTPLEGIPVVLRAPEDQTVTVGDSVRFKVTAAGVKPLTYQWLFNDSPLFGETNFVLSLVRVFPNHAGAYALQVTNPFGTVTSPPAMLRLSGQGTLVLPRPFRDMDGTPSPVLRDPIRMHDVYGASLFPGGPILIREIRFRPSAFYGGPFAATISNLQVSLSTTRRAPDALTSTLDNNLGTNTTTVFNGSLTVTSAFRGPVAGPKDFDILIPFTVPFVFDPAEGNLLVDIRNFSGSTALLVDAGDAPGDASSRAFRLNQTGSSGRDSGADIMQFSYTSLEMPPRFVANPESSTVILGDTARMSVVGSGTPPLSYAWFFDGTAMPGATNASLVLSNAQFSQGGSYFVVLSNPFGVATSAVATLTVTNLGKWIVPQQYADIDARGATTTLRSRLRVQQVYAAETLPDQPILIRELRFRPSSVSGFAFNATISNIQISLSTTLAQPNALDSTFANNVGRDETTVFSGPLALRSAFIGPAGGPKEFDVVVPLITPFFYASGAGNLLMDTINFSGSGASSLDGHLVYSNHASRAFATTTNATVATGRDAGADVVKIVYSRLDDLTGLSIVREPQNRSVYIGDDARFQVVALGAWPLSFQWLFNGLPLAQQTNAALHLVDVQFGDAGLYSVIVTNTSGSVTSALAELVVTVPPPAIVVRGPYLQSMTTSNLVIRWRTDRPVDSRVQFGPEFDLDHEAFNFLPSTEHVLVLTNLAPDTRYGYAVGTATTPLAGGTNHWFRTPPSSPKPIRIWAIGDCGTASLGRTEPFAVRDAYLNHTRALPTDVWLMLGDNAYPSGTDAEYQAAVFDVYQELLRHTPLWPTIGNHETYAAAGNGHITYYDIFTLPEDGSAGGLASGTERYYSFDYGNIHFVCLDSEISDKSPGGAMLTWLEQDLTANTKDWLIAYWHSPPYSRGSHNSDFEANLFLMREWVVPVLENYGIDLVLCGHSHSYERSLLIDGHYGLSSGLTPLMIMDAGSGRMSETGAYLKSTDGPQQSRGAVYVVAGSAGQISGGLLNHPAMFVSLNQLGSVVIDVDGNRLNAAFLRETGVVDDHFTILKSATAEALRFATFRVQNGVVTGQWKSIAGKSYEIQESTNVESRHWTPVSDIIVASGATSSWSGTVSTGAEKSFYRVMQLD